MADYSTPGVYYERVDASPAITAIRTDIAGFVGIAPRGPVDHAVVVQSWRQYVATFGGYSGAGYLAYAVRGFFENGGRRCWVVRVAAAPGESGEALTAGVTLSNSVRRVWRIAANSPGVWGNDLDIRAVETNQAATVSVAGECTPEYCTVFSTSGFGRGTLVRLAQEALESHRVVSEVDPVRNRLYWLHPRVESRLPYDQAVTIFNLDLPLRIESVEYTLQVWELGRLLQVYRGLSLVPQHERYAPQLLRDIFKDAASGGTATVAAANGDRAHGSQDARRRIAAAPEPVVIEEVRDLERPTLDDMRPLVLPKEERVPLLGGSDGLVGLQVYDFTGSPIDALDSDLVKRQKRRGLETLDSVDEVAILAVPDIHIQPLVPPALAPLPPCIPDPCLPSSFTPMATRPSALGELPPIFDEAAIFQVQLAMVAQCERRRDRIALLDVPYGAARNAAIGVGVARAWRSRFDSKYAAFYYPWLRVVDPLRRAPALTRDIPPTGHIAGQYALTDAQVGVHKAPANAALGWVQDVTTQVDDAVHGLLNPLGINVVRVLTGRGIRIYGARTVSSDPDWRYVNVRRLLMMIEKAVGLATQWATFEPNDFRTRAKLQLALRIFLLTLWQQGALMGNSAEAAFFVKCDDENNPPEARANGRLLAEVGVAPSQPFEFVVLRVGRVNNEFEINEMTLQRGGF